MSCAYRTHRYRSSVTAHPDSCSWEPTTGHAQHPIPLRPLVVYPHRQAVTETADDAPIPAGLVQYLWSRWHQAPTSVHRDEVVAAFGELMQSPRWHWDVTVLPDQSLPDPQGSFVSERDGRPTIGIPIDMLRELWRWVLDVIDERAPVLRWWVPTLDPALWQELRTHQPARGRRLTDQDWSRLYGYLSPVLLPDIARATDHLLSSADPRDQQMALTVLERWMASPDSATRTLAAQMLSTWLNQQAATSPTDDQLRLRALTILAPSDDPAVVSTRLYDLLRTVWNRITPDDVRTVMTLLHRLGDGRLCATDRWRSLLGEIVRDHPSDDVIHEVLDRLMPAIRSSAHPDDRVRWAVTLWNLMTDSTLDEWRRWMIATALTPMMQEPMVAAAALVHAQLRTEQTLPSPICDTLLTGLIQTAHADAVLTMITQAIRQDRNAIARFAPIVAAGWGHGHDHRILQIITSHPSPHWRTVLTPGITTSVGAEVCAFIQSQAPGSPDHAVAVIMDHVWDREDREDWPLAPLPAHLIPWVCEAARRCPGRLHPTTIRRLWLADPDRAWNVTQAMLDSGHPFVQERAIAAMDAGWGTGHDAEVATTLRARILEHQDDRGGIGTIENGIATAVAGIGIAPPSLIAPLLTELAMQGNENVQRQLISALHRGWGRGQNALVLRIVKMIAERYSSEWVWSNARATLLRAWDYHPPHVVVSLVDRVVTHGMIPDAIAAYAPGWTHLPTAQVIERITHHVAHLHEHAHTLDPSIRDTLVAAWTQVIAAGAERLSTSDIHAVLAPLWDLSPYGCLTGVAQWVDR